MADSVAGRKDAVVLAISVLPDVCTMPNGSIGCFDLVAVGTDAVKQCTTVRANGTGVIKLDTQLMQCTGDESASGGTASSTIKGTVDMLPNQCTVNSECQCTMRDGDPVLMNNKNTLGVLKVLETATGIGVSGASKYGEMVNDHEAADKKARRMKNRRPKNRGKTKKHFDRANKKYQEATKTAKGMEVPGGTSRLGKSIGSVVKKAPHVDKALDAVSIGGEVLEGDACGVLTKASGIGAGAATGAAGTWGCGALGLAGGWPGLLCMGFVIVGSAYAGSKAEEATGTALGTNSCPADPAQQPPVDGTGIASSPTPPAATTPAPGPAPIDPAPSPAPAPTPPP